MNDIVWLTMRRLRSPLIILILVYFLSVMAMVMVPGVDDNGQPYHLNLLDAAYFIAILSTTIGLGEVPYPFSNAQRMLVFIIILPNVVAWLYSVGTILSLFLDREFKGVLQRSRFIRQASWQGESFYIVCGFGNTGSMIVRGLLKRGLQVVVLERNPDIVHRMMLEDVFSHVPALGCDTTDRRNLEQAGMHRKNCRGVIVTTNEDHDNLTIAITSKLLEPCLPVLARCEDENIIANMQSFGTDFVVNPFTIFAERLFLALSSPLKYLVQDWLISVPGTELRELLVPPRGRWIVCGAGRFGGVMAEQLRASGMPCTVIEIDKQLLENHPGGVLGRGTEAKTLEAAGVHEAAGIIAGTDNDIDNLSIVMTARELNRQLFVVARQENQQNGALFDVCGADLVARRSKIVARRILAVATTPLLQTFLEHLVREDEDFAERTAARLRDVLYNRSPNLWVAELAGDQAVGLMVAHEGGIELQLRQLTRNNRSARGEALACVCLVLERGAQRIFLPHDELILMEGDRLLFAGRGSAQLEMVRALTDPVLLWDAATVKSMPRSAFWRGLQRNKDRPDS
jgi:Trk K+ transport system NAD-binding subunit